MTGLIVNVIMTIEAGPRVIVTMQLLFGHALEQRLSCFWSLLRAFVAAAAEERESVIS